MLDIRLPRVGGDGDAFRPGRDPCELEIYRGRFLTLAGRDGLPCFGKTGRGGAQLTSTGSDAGKLESPVDAAGRLRRPCDAAGAQPEPRACNGIALSIGHLAGDMAAGCAVRHVAVRKRTAWNLID